MNKLHIYISPHGNDKNNGDSAGPLKTIDMARERARSARSSNGHRPAVITLQAGTYPLSAALTLDNRDSGTADAPVLWRAADGGKFLLPDQKFWTVFTSIDNNGLLASLSPESGAAIRQISFQEAGIPVPDQIRQRGAPPLELFHKNTRLPLSRWPSEDWIKISEVPQTGEQRLNDGLDREKRFDGVPAGRHYGKFTYKEDKPSLWNYSEEILVHGYWTWDWNDSIQTLNRIDGSTKTVFPCPAPSQLRLHKKSAVCFSKYTRRGKQTGEMVFFIAVHSRFIYSLPSITIRARLRRLF